MARPKKDPNEVGEVSDYLDASYILDTPKNVIKISSALDYILGGGWPESTIGLLAAAPKIGKTTLALKIAAKGQQQFGKTVIYINVENRLKEMNLKGVKGLDLSPDKFKLISSQPGQILNAEHFLEKTEKALIDFPNSVCIFDSFSSLSSSVEKGNAYGEGFGNVSARKMEGEFARRVSPIISVNNSIVIGICHVTPNLNMPGSSTKVSKALEYQMDINLRMKKVYPQGDWTSGDRLIGQKINIDCLTSALGAPGKSCVGWLKYGEGFNDEAELAQMAIDLSLIEKKGAGWYTVGEEKAQGMEALCELLSKKKDLYEELEYKVAEMLQ